MQCCYTIQAAVDNESAYLRDIHADHIVEILPAIIIETLENNEDNCIQRFNYLWATDMGEYFAAFLEDAMILSPNNQKFSDAIVKYQQIREALQHFQSPMNIDWLRINTQPVKSQLIAWTSLICL